VAVGHAIFANYGRGCDVNRAHVILPVTWAFNFVLLA